ncbi:hypothetical protein [uncultured Pontibacter sp.]|uniref:hypothetical protein n=1 Tax=uncultured Pontibacter sp. TaxID=453356 RepID=UPI0026104C5E|nr:hypothetical protein [uncultured Pontibacter sp.]
MTKPAPDEVGGARVILYASLEGKKATGRTEHFHTGKSVNPTTGLAICKYDNEDGYYLFGCDLKWESVTDTLHETVEDAIEQAEWEYGDLSGAWVKK